MHDDVTPTMSLIVVRVTVAAATTDELVGRCARWFRDGQVLFVPTEAVQPSGRRVRFVLALAGGQDAIVGEGVVLRMRRDSGDPRRPPGMELRYDIVDEASAALVERILAAQRTPPPYVSLRIDRAQLSRPAAAAASEPTMVATPLPPPRATSARLTAMPRPPSPDAAARGWRIVGVGLATAAAMLAVAIAMAMMRRLPPASAPVAVGGNGVVLANAVAAPDPAFAEPPPLAVDERARHAESARPMALRIHTTPSGATVFVDGDERGPSPLTVTVAGGAHEVVAERPRWLRAHAHVDGPGKVELALERPPARLRVTSTPPGAAVRLDGRDVGTTPLELDAAAFELHHVRIALDGRVWKRRVYLRPSGAAVSVDEPGPIRVAHDLGERVRP